MLSKGLSSQGSPEASLTDNVPLQIDWQVVSAGLFTFPFWHVVAFCPKNRFQFFKGKVDIG